MTAEKVLSIIEQSAPLSSSSLTTSSKPPRQASWSGVVPERSVASIGASLFINSWQTSYAPLAAAQSRGVHPFVLRSSTLQMVEVWAL